MKAFILNILAFIKKIPSLLKRMVKFLFPKKNEDENIFQYIVRQFYFTDSRGYPSLTVTILFFVMGIVLAVTIIECKLALLTQKGFSVSFLSLVISLAVVITTFYRQRQKGIKETPDQELIVDSSGTIDKIKGYIESVLGTGEKKTPPSGGPVGK